MSIKSSCDILNQLRTRRHCIYVAPGTMSRSLILTGGPGPEFALASFLHVSLRFCGSQGEASFNH